MAPGGSAATAPRVYLFPRRKSGDSDVPVKGRLPIQLDRESIASMFRMPQPEASRALGVSLTALKQVCRKLGISRWPYQRSCSQARRSRHSRRPRSGVPPGPQLTSKQDASASGPLTAISVLDSGQGTSPLPIGFDDGSQPAFLPMPAAPAKFPPPEAGPAATVYRVRHICSPPSTSLSLLPGLRAVQASPRTDGQRPLHETCAMVAAAADAHDLHDSAACWSDEDSLASSSAATLARASFSATGSVTPVPGDRGVPLCPGPCGKRDLGHFGHLSSSDSGGPHNSHNQEQIDSGDSLAWLVGCESEGTHLRSDEAEEWEYERAWLDRCLQAQGAESKPAWCACSCWPQKDSRCPAPLLQTVSAMESSI